MNVENMMRSIEINSLTLPNRLVMAPMTRSKSAGNVPGPETAAYYRRRAENNVGLILTEGTVVDPATGHAYPDVPDFAGEKALEGWKHVVEQVHMAGGLIFPQLWHAGAVRQGGMPPDPSQPGYGPSPIAFPGLENAEPAREMTGQDIYKIILAFARAAGEARKIGFDGVEIHGAHGYLVDQFFWSRTNQRSDRYGGDSAARRTRFAVELIQAVRRTVGGDFPICLRFSQWKLNNFDAKLAETPAKLEAFLGPLSDAGVDVFHCSTRRFFEPEFPDSPLNLAGWTKKITGKPVITVGSIGLDLDFISTLMEGKAPRESRKTIDELMERMDRGEVDLVAVGRALLADPEWFTKIVENRFDEIKTFTRESLETLY